jgi:hypothetical protein
MKTNIAWLKEPEEHDYPAAESYLGLVYGDAEVAEIVARLRKAGTARFKAKDIFRASGLPLLGIGNKHIQKDQLKIQDGRKLSPLLLVRDARSRRLIIADGYHRLCAVYSFDEDAEVPCRIVDGDA